MTTAPTLAAAPPPGFGHISAIDGLRGLAVLLVVVAHTILIRPACWLDEQAAAILGAGWCGVDLFFVISGFLITGILFDAKGGDRYFRSFYARRTLRIFPIYYLALFMLLIVLPRIAIPQADAYRDISQHQGWFWLHLSNFHFAATGFTGDATDVFWSLAIEEQYYLIWPLVVWFLSRAALMRVSIALIVCALVLRTVLPYAGIKPVAIYVLPFTRMDGLAAGAFVALLARGPGGLAAYLPAARTIAIICAAGLVLLIALMGGLPIWGTATQTIGYSLLVGLFASLLILAQNRDAEAWLRRAVDRPLLRTFGCYSYAIYIGHLPVRMLLRAVGFDLHTMPTILGSALPGQLVFTLAVILVSLVAAIVSWHVFEKHVLKLKRYFPYESSKDRPSIAGTILSTDSPPAQRRAA